MPGDDLVVSDTSPLLNLALIGRLDLIREQFTRVKVPEQVWNELLSGEDGVDSLQSLRSEGTLETVVIEDGPLIAELRRELDRGEAAALAYAIEEGADRLLLDERAARQAARRHGIPVTGAVGVLMRATRDSHTLQSELDALRAAGFWISDELYQEALERMSEK